MPFPGARRAAGHSRADPAWKPSPRPGCGRGSSRSYRSRPRSLAARGATRVSVKEALGWSALRVALALLFAAWLWQHLSGTAGPEVAREKTLEYLTGYLIEKSLSVDNIFVFLMLFTYFAVPPELQRRTLVYGVLGAIALRIIMILLGASVAASLLWRPRTRV